MIRFFAHWLIILAAWTLVIKYAFPLVFDTAYDHPLGTHVLWDFWWVIHLWLAYVLVSWKPYTYRFALGVSAVEIIIIVSKFALFFRAPEWTIWQTNWFINKVFVLACFVALMIYLLCHRGKLSGSNSSDAD